MVRNVAHAALKLGLLLSELHAVLFLLSWLFRLVIGPDGNGSSMIGLSTTAPATAWSVSINTIAVRVIAKKNFYFVVFRFLTFLFVPSP